MNYSNAREGLHIRFRHHDGTRAGGKAAPVFRLRPHLSYKHDETGKVTDAVPDGWDRVVVVPHPPYAPWSRPPLHRGQRLSVHRGSHAPPQGGSRVAPVGPEWHSSARPMTPRAGSLGLLHLKGGTGLVVRAFQAVTGRRIRGSNFAHAFVAVGGYYDGTVHGGPGGAYTDDLSYYMPGGESGERTVFVDVEMTDSQRRAVVVAAWDLSEAPYAGPLGYMYLILSTLRLPRRWLRNYLDRSGRFLCSGLVAEIYRRAGVPLTDHESVHDVTPGDLARFALTDPRARVLTLGVPA